MKISEQHKTFLVIAGIIVMLMICFKVAFRSTIDLAVNYNMLKSKAEIADSLPSEIARMEKQLAEIDANFFEAISSKDDMHNVLMEKLGSIAKQNRVALIEYPAEHKFTTSTVRIETHSATLKGRFIDLLKILYHLEVKERLGRIVSVEYFTETNRRTKVRSLYMRLHIQNYSNLKKNEKQ